MCGVPEGQKYVLRKWGSYAEIHSLNRVVSAKPKSSRGSVSGASDKSRRRLVGSIFKARVQLRYLVTLTYETDDIASLSAGDPQGAVDLSWPGTSACLPPPKYTCDFRPLKRDLQAMLRWLERRDIRALWFLEFTSAGRPHWHLMTDTWLPCGWREIERRGRTVRVAKYDGGHAEFVDHWMAVTKQKNPRFHRGGITEELLSTDGAMRYASKEASKRAQKNAPGGAITGRMWGMPREWRREHDSEEKIVLAGEPMFSRIYNVSDGIPIRPDICISYESGSHIPGKSKGRTPTKPAPQSS